MATTLPKPLDLTRFREDFPILRTQVNGRPLIYLDNAATSQKPQHVLDVLDAYWTQANANVHRGVHHLSQKATKQFDDAREKIRILLNARSTKEVILTKGCTEGINLVANGIGSAPLNVGSGDEILLSHMEHHSNIVPWQIAAEKVGAVIKVIPITDAGEIDLQAYEELLSERTKIVGIVHVSNSLGTINPVKQMVAMAHRVGALVLVDGAQAGPHHLIDVQDIDADFYTLSCHKIYAPTGVGVLYGKQSLLEAMPPYHGGGDMIRTVSFEKSTYADLPAKFEAGTPNIAGVIGLGAAIDYLAGMARQSLSQPELPQREALEQAYRALHAQEVALTDYTTERLSQMPGLRITGTAKEKAGIIAFTLEGAHPHDIGTILDSEGIGIRAGHHCCMPLMKRLGVPATARASFAFYNTFEEADQLIDGIGRVREMFAC
jgi:cysteine desulfurase/selenocysteine lyase